MLLYNVKYWNTNLNLKYQCKKYDKNTNNIIYACMLLTYISEISFLV